MRSFLCLCLSLGCVLSSRHSNGPSPLRIDGLVAAVMTPFDNTGEVDLSVVPGYHKYLNRTGVEWAFVGGTTGESLSLTVAERKALLEKWLTVSSNVIAHVGCDSIKDAQELARHAVSAGARAIAAMPPVFFKPANAQALALTMTAICGEAPKLPCYYYHIPSMSGYSQPMIDFVKAMDAPGMATNFAGIKYTGLYTYPGYMDAMRVMNHAGGKYEVLSGREDMMLEGLSIGIKGHVGSQFNYAGDLYNKIRNTFEQDGLTPTSSPVIRATQMTAVNLISTWGVAPAGMNGNKYFMNLAGVPVGDARLPSIPLDSNAKQTLSEAFHQFCSGEGSSFYMCQQK